MRLGCSNFGVGVFAGDLMGALCVVRGWSDFWDREFGRGGTNGKI